MTKKEIHNGNKLITQFMGWELKQTKDEFKYWHFKHKITKEIILLNDTGRGSFSKHSFWNKHSAIDYYNSWDNLMLVIGRMYDSLIGVTSNGSFLYEGRVKDGLLKLNKNKVFVNIVDYIKWYNKQKKSRWKKKQ